MYRENTRRSRVFFSRANFSYDEEYNNFLTHLAEFSNQTLFSKRVKVASAVLCSLVKYANISQSQSLLELFKQFE